MKIAQVSPLWESVPPKGYGGIERVVSYLTEELVARGHEVTLFASGDSETSAELVSCSDQALRGDDRRCVEADSRHLMMMETVWRQRRRFDVIHCHLELLSLPYLRRLDVPHLMTMHGRLDVGGVPRLYREYADIPVVSISYAQRRPLPGANWVGNVYNGIPGDFFEPSFEPDDYLVFLGRLSPDKAPHLAIEVARRAGVPLKIAAKLDPYDREYFEEKVKGGLENPLVEFLGEVNDKEKRELLRGAIGLILPIQWPEPFGLVMTEAFACGTPVIAFRNGSVPEIVRHGQTGFVVDGVEEAVAAVGRLAEIDRRECRRHFDRKFSKAIMVDGYLKLFEALQQPLGIQPNRLPYPAAQTRVVA